MLVIPYKLFLVIVTYIECFFAFVYIFSLIFDYTYYVITGFLTNAQNSSVKSYKSYYKVLDHLSVKTGNIKSSKPLQINHTLKTLNEHCRINIPKKITHLPNKLNTNAQAADSYQTKPTVDYMIREYNYYFYTLSSKNFEYG